MSDDESLDELAVNLSDWRCQGLLDWQYDPEQCYCRVVFWAVDFYPLIGRYWRTLRLALSGYRFYS